jgi:hypothetical protein
MKASAPRRWPRRSPVSDHDHHDPSRSQRAFPRVERRLCRPRQTPRACHCTPSAYAFPSDSRRSLESVCLETPSQLASSVALGAKEALPMARAVDPPSPSFCSSRRWSGSRRASVIDGHRGPTPPMPADYVGSTVVVEGDPPPPSRRPARNRAGWCSSFEPVGPKSFVARVLVDGLALHAAALARADLSGEGVSASPGLCVPALPGSAPRSSSRPEPDRGASDRWPAPAITPTYDDDDHTLHKTPRPVPTTTRAPPPPVPCPSAPAASSPEQAPAIAPAPPAAVPRHGRRRFRPAKPPPASRGLQPSAAPSAPRPRLRSRTAARRATEGPEPRSGSRREAAGMLQAC